MNVHTGHTRKFQPRHATHEIMFRFLSVAILVSASSAFVAPIAPSKLTMSSVAMNVHTGAGKGFGGGEATRDPQATFVDPNDPKGKQQAIHKAESFADYLARRQGGAPAPAPVEAPAAAPAPVSYSAPAAWMAKIGQRGKWGGNVVPTQPIYEAAPASAPAPAQELVTASGDDLWSAYLAQRG